jgi:5,5'-dehydrodivanillate O-demethylase oxygenase subunit
MATTQEQNERLTHIGPGTAMGNLLRRYWHVIGTVSELGEEPVQKVRLLGEDLTLFRTEGGEYGLVDDVCPHRCMSLEYGIPQEKGLRCAYHGWLFDPAGRCLEQPFEEYTNPQARFKDKIQIKAYPVQALGGILFTYMGPAPAPLLPRWDLLVRDDLDAAIEVHELPCNWLQCMDNSLDPIHFEHLHAVFGNYQLQKLGRPPAMFPARHIKIGFDRFEYGIYKRRLLEGEPEDIDDWQIGHPILFPNTLAVGEEHRPMLQIRIPVDDTHTLHMQYVTSVRKSGAERRPVEVFRRPLYEPDGTIIADNIPKQDELAWVAQGPISQRTREHLGTSDVGIILYHKMLFEEMEKVERGEEPLGVIRDRAVNEPFIRIRRERQGYQAFRSNFEAEYERVEHTLVAAG